MAWGAHKKICPFVLLSEKRKHPQKQRKRIQVKRLWDWKIIPNFECI